LESDGDNFQKTALTEILQLEPTQILQIVQIKKTEEEGQRSANI